MSDARAALVIKSIVQEVVAACIEAGHTDVNEALASFMVKCIILDPESDFRDDMQLTREDVGQLIETCVVRLSAENSLSLSTIKMQLLFQQKYASLDDIISIYRTQRTARYEQIENEILSASPTNIQEEIELLYSKLIQSNLMRTNMGPHSDFNVIRESTAALESVLPPVELGVFMSLSVNEKRKQLDDLSMIVGGIRLFNKFTGKGGAEIKDYVLIVPEQVSLMLQRTHEDLCKFSQLTGVFAQCQMNDQAQELHFMCAVANARQYQTYLGILHADAIALASQVSKVCNSYQTRQNQLKTAIQSKTAVPTDQVYPLFIELADLYMTLDICSESINRMQILHQDVSGLMHTLVRFLEENQPLCLEAADNQNEDNRRVYSDYVNAVYSQTSAALNLIAPTTSVPNPNVQVSPSAQVLEANDVNQKGKHGSVALLIPGVTHNYETIPISLGGHCAYSASLSPPVLRVANRKLGMLQYVDHKYGFINQLAATKFLADPDDALGRILENAKKYPELLELLQLHEHFASFAPDSHTPAVLPNTSKKPLMCDSGTQSEIHPVESNIVPNYDHSEWELRKKAIKLANLRTKKTHSTQTENSNYRREATSQVFLPKASTTQTRKTTGTNVPKPVTYIRGLRGPHGRHAKQVEVVDLTTDIGGLVLNIRGLTGSAKADK